MTAPRGVLPPVFAITFLGSLGTGAVTNGISFLAKQGFGFDARENFTLGVVMGASYIPAAVFSGRIIRAVKGVASTRSVLIATQALAALACAAPVALDAAGVLGKWFVYAFAALYLALSGILWPVVESYLSGGRTDKQLVGAVGKFNLIWASAVFISMASLGPIMERSVLWCMFALSGVHVLCIAAAVWLPRDTRPHEHSEHAAPESYRRLLSVFRGLLPMSYIVLSGIAPYMPFALDRVGVDTVAQPAVAATWMVSRFATFLLLERWHGWHGRMSPAVAAIVLLVVGVVVVLLAPVIAPDTPGLDTLALAVLLSGLALVGVGCGVVYVAALYYALEVGAAEIDAGGAHEGLIGLGYVAGPALGLVSVAAASTTQAVGSEQMMMLLIGGVCAAVSVVVLVRVGKARSGNSSRHDNVSSSTKTG